MLFQCLTLVRASWQSQNIALLALEQHSRAQSDWVAVKAGSAQTQLCQNLLCRWQSMSHSHGPTRSSFETEAKRNPTTKQTNPRPLVGGDHAGNTFHNSMDSKVAKCDPLWVSLQRWLSAPASLQNAPELMHSPPHLAFHPWVLALNLVVFSIILGYTAHVTNSSSLSIQDPGHPCGFPFSFCEVLTDRTYLL